MKNITKAVLCSILLMLSTAASSEEGFYFGLGIGQSQFSLNEPTLISSYSLNPGSSFSDTATAFSLFGGFRLDQHLSLEMDFVMGGDVTTTSGSQSSKLFDTSGLSLTAMASSKITDNISLFGRVGAVFWDITEGSIENSVTINNATDLTYGAGIDINLYGGADRQLRLQWNHYEYDGVFLKTSDAFTGSLLFLFDSN